MIKVEVMCGKKNQIPTKHWKTKLFRFVLAKSFCLGNIFRCKLFDRETNGVLCSDDAETAWIAKKYNTTKYFCSVLGGNKSF